jgi:uncharacterized protein (TIGR03435 family)
MPVARRIVTDLGIAFAVTSVFVALDGRAWPQSAPRPQFDVVSIRPSQWIHTIEGDTMDIRSEFTPKSLTMRGILLKDLIARAYSLQPYQIYGPACLGSEHYDILAKTSSPASDSLQRTMLQDTLATRFEMAAHFETKVLPCYELVVAKGGLIVGKAGLKKHEASPEDDIGPRWLSTSRPGIIAAEVTLSRFAGFLTRKMDRPVVDKTGIPGEFDIDLRFAPLGANPEDDAELSVFQAIQMVGLKLEPRKSPVQVLVVDHISKPSPN